MIKGVIGKIYSTIRIKDKSAISIKAEKRTIIKSHLSKEEYFLSKNLLYFVIIENLVILNKSFNDIFITQKKPNR